MGLVTALNPRERGHETVARAPYPKSFIPICHRRSCCSYGVDVPALWPLPSRDDVPARSCTVLFESRSNELFSATSGSQFGEEWAKFEQKIEEEELSSARIGA